MQGANRNLFPAQVNLQVTICLVLCVGMGAIAFAFRHQKMFVYSTSLHAVAFMAVSSFLPRHIGELFFNREEAEVFLHRPVAPRAVLWAKISLVSSFLIILTWIMSCWAFLIGASAPDGGWRFIPVHAVSSAMQALFCIGCLVLGFQLCLRWVDRKRLDSAVLTAQLLVGAVMFVASRFFFPLINSWDGRLFSQHGAYWICLFPPTWFAGFDEALAGAGTRSSWGLAILAIAGTCAVSGWSLVTLAGTYATGLQAVGEPLGRRPRGRSGASVVGRLLGIPPFSWWFREPLARASFLLCGAYLTRDRELKLRLYPAVLPWIVIPLVPAFRRVEMGGVGLWAGFSCALVALAGLEFLEYSQDWRAAQVFRTAPLASPAPIADGARRAVLCFLVGPLTIVFAAIVWLVSRTSAEMRLLLPGLIVAPLYALIPSLMRRDLPLSVPPGRFRGRKPGEFVAVIFCSVALAGLTLLAGRNGWFWWMIGGEMVFVSAVYFPLRTHIRTRRWKPMPDVLC